MRAKRLADMRGKQDDVPPVAVAQAAVPILGSAGAQADLGVVTVLMPNFNTCESWVCQPSHQSMP